MIMLNVCPVCRGTLFEESLYQYSVSRKIHNWHATVMKRGKKLDLGPIDAVRIVCENGCFETDYELNIIKPQSLTSKKITTYKGKYCFEGYAEL